MSTTTATPRLYTNMGILDPVYAAIRVTSGGDVQQTIAHMDNPKLVPYIYQLRLEETHETIDLVSTFESSSEVVLKMDKQRVDQLVHALGGPLTGDCERVVTGYQLLACQDGEGCISMMYGPLTFVCPDQGDEGIEVKNPNTVVVESRAQGHKFDHGHSGGPGGFDGSFLSTKES